MLIEDEWFAVKNQIKELEAIELKLRERIIASNFLDLHGVGTKSVELASGKIAKAVFRHNYKVTKDADYCKTALSLIKKIYPENFELCENLFKFSVSISSSSFNKLSDDAKKIAEKCFELKYALPSLEILEKK
jgi:hypothetical protein